MKVAFCFLTQSNLHQPVVWDRFFLDADTAQYNIYSHVKYPAAVSDNILAANKIREYIPTRSGHVSIVVATTRLFEAAFEDDEDNTFFILLSESTIPIEPFKKVVHKLTAARCCSIISFRVPSLGSEHHFRLNSVIDWRIFADKWFHHDQWIVLHRSHVDALLRTPCYSMFEDVFAADEHYFMNVLVHVCGTPLSEILNRRTTFINWYQSEVIRDPLTGVAQT